ncbi:CoA-binding protein [Granulicella arctica]|uniref:CoA-binding protein n=1 Tax=Granulicella arctica TaxID=940613 RepID=UPI0021E0DE79|nr:CoA-binding protein [Granulicella arctica]
MNEPEILRSMLSARTIAVVGLSDRPDRPSHYVSEYMQQHGYTIYPVNPALTEVLGEKSYASLSDLPVKPDLVNVFRVPSLIPGIVDEMLMLGLTDIWVQQGIVNREAAIHAEQGGIRVVMDRCIMVEHRNARLA